MLTLSKTRLSIDFRDTAIRQSLDDRSPNSNLHCPCDSKMLISTGGGGGSFSDSSSSFLYNRTETQKSQAFTITGIEAVGIPKMLWKTGFILYIAVVTAVAGSVTLCLIAWELYLTNRKWLATRYPAWREGDDECRLSRRLREFCEWRDRTPPMEDTVLCTCTCWC